MIGVENQPFRIVRKSCAAIYRELSLDAIINTSLLIKLILCNLIIVRASLSIRSCDIVSVIPASFMIDVTLVHSLFILCALEWLLCLMVFLCPIYTLYFSAYV